MFTFKYDTLVENNTSSREIEIDKHFSVRWDLGSKRFEIINNDLKKIEKIDLDNKIIGIVRLNNYLIFPNRSHFHEQFYFLICKYF